MFVYIRESDKDKIICNVDEKDIAEHLRIRLKKEQEEKEHKKKEKADAHLYTIIKVVRDDDLAQQTGKDIYFDLVDHEKVCSFHIPKQIPFNHFKAKFLKSCAAILETPIEIRKTSVDQSLASDPCCIKLNWDQQLEKNDDLTIVDPETLIFEEEKLKSCERDENNDTRKKMVRFQELNAAALQISPQTENQIQPYGFESPYPTPLKLVDGMQAPGTIYPQNSENFRIGRMDDNEAWKYVSPKN